MVLCRLRVTKMGLPRHTEGIGDAREGAHKKGMHERSRGLGAKGDRSGEVAAQSLWIWA